MITLPDGWENCIQITDLHTELSNFGIVGSLVLNLQNQDRQQWGVNRSIVVPGIEMALQKDAVVADRLIKERMQEAYLDILERVREESLVQEKAFRVVNHVVMEERIHNDVWKCLLYPEFEVYKP